MKLILKTLTILSLSFAALQAKAESIALVLSFENYQNSGDLRGALAGHDDLLAAYRAAGYQTSGGRDRSNSQLRRLLRNFVEDLDSADKAVIHITGQVVTYGAQSWILPSDTEADSVANLEIDGISVNFLLELLATKPGQSVLFLGMANRNFDNIQGVRRGVNVDNIPDGVMLVSGAYSDVTRAVLRDFLEPDSIVIEALAQNARKLEVNGDIPYALVLADDSPQPPRATTPEEFEAALRLSRNQRRAIQTDLTLLGYNLGTVDGLFGNATRRALRNWQQHERLAITGYLTLNQIQQLDRQAAAARRALEDDDRNFWARTGAAGTLTGLRAYLNRYPDGLFATRAQNEVTALERDSDITEWNRAADADTLESYQRYLQRYPEGIYNRLAKAKVQEILANQPDPQEDARRAEDRLRLDEPSRLLIELRLAGLGYRVGPADGVFNNATRRAIRKYQQDRNLPVTGYVSSNMIRLLLLGR